MQDTKHPHIVALMGSYRQGGTIDQSVAELLDAAREEGANVEQINLAEQHIEFCQNCRTCTQVSGPDRGACVIEDDLEHVLGSLERADAIVLAAPVNYGDVNALTRRLLERMVGYTHWPFGAKAPKLRNPKPDKPAVLITSSAAPALMTRAFARPLRTLRQMAKMLRAKPVGTLVAGMAGGTEPTLSPQTKARARALGERLAKSKAPALRLVQHSASQGI